MCSSDLAGHDVASFDPWFQRELGEIDAFRDFLSSIATNLTPEILLQAKVMGFSDKDIAKATGCDEQAVRAKRCELGIHPTFGEVDTCAGEFEAKTPYYYSYYGWGTTGKTSARSTRLAGQKRKIMVLGGGAPAGRRTGFVESCFEHAEEIFEWE